MGDPRDLNNVFNAQFELGRFRHHVLRPRRVKHQVALDSTHTGDTPHLRFHLGRQGAGHGAARRGERHPDGNKTCLIHIDLIDEAKLIDVDRHLGVINRTEDLDDLLPKLAGCHSVDTASPAPRSAARNVCQASVAHFTRAGNSRTPENTTSLPRSFGNGRSVVRSSWNFASRVSASPTVLPFKTSVIKDAEAVEIAHPAPWNVTLSITPSCSLRKTLHLSPHSGL